MTNQVNRRFFVKLSAVGLAVVSLGNLLTGRSVQAQARSGRGGGGRKYRKWKWTIHRLKPLVIKRMQNLVHSGRVLISSVRPVFCTAANQARNGDRVRFFLTE